MSGLNTTGLPDTGDYLLGRGTLYFGVLDANGRATLGFRDLGNGPAFKMSMKTTKLDHKSSRSGLAVTDKSVIIEQTVEVTIELDELNFQNLALAFSGGTAAPTNGAIAGWANYTMIPAPGVTLGTWYDLVQNLTGGNRAYGVDVADLTVKKTGGAALVEGVGYILDLTMGRIQFPATGGSIVAGDTIDVTLTADGAAPVLEEVRALTSTPVAGCLKFVGENPANGDEQQEVQVHKIALVADGDVDFIGDQFAKITLKGVAEANTVIDANSPYFSIRTHAEA